MAVLDKRNFELVMGLPEGKKKRLMKKHITTCSPIPQDLVWK